jgi:hypothetical protein
MPFSLWLGLPWCSTTLAARLFRVNMSSWQSQLVITRKHEKSGPLKREPSSALVCSRTFSYGLTSGGSVRAISPRVPRPSAACLKKHWQNNSSLRRWGGQLAYLGFAFFSIAVMLSIPINGFVIATTWGWFIVPIFEVREISLAEAVGLSIFASIISQPRPFNLSKNTGDDDSTVMVWRMIGNMASQVFGPALTLMGAWVWHTFLCRTLTNLAASDPEFAPFTG